MKSAGADQEICRRFGDVVYSVDVDGLEQVVVQALRERGLTLATAESCTGGLLAKRITDVPGASEAAASHNLLRQRGGRDSGPNRQQVKATTSGPALTPLASITARPEAAAR